MPVTQLARRCHIRCASGWSGQRRRRARAGRLPSGKGSVRGAVKSVPRQINVLWALWHFAHARVRKRKSARPHTHVRTCACVYVSLGVLFMRAWFTGLFCKEQNECMTPLYRVINHSSWRMSALFFLGSPPSNVTISILLCCVYINDCKIYAKRIRWCQVFLARSWESCQTCLFLINEKRAASWLHLTRRGLLTPCQVKFNYLKFVFFMLYELQYLSCWHPLYQPLHIQTAMTANCLLSSSPTSKKSPPSVSTV